ncbi:MAG: hypothetical protein JSV24_10765 [Bacteroidales bacterium]|nr:MAG: hypothetical protein JSV24_10765 [Bacteroidales bacterium]
MEDNAMFNLISLKVKCPVCGKSLMDEEHLVDNCPSIKLKIEIGEANGTINLSSVWDSYNYLVDIELTKDEIATLRCPLCNSDLKSRIDCDVCKAPMVPFDLKLGGDVSICSRIGCKNHFLKFVDFSFALKNLFEDTDRLHHHLEDFEVEKLEIIRSGTFLQSYCPHCKKSLIEEGSIKFKVKRGKEKGFIMLSPYLNIFTSRSTILLPEDQIIEDISCPKCNKSLVLKDQKCGECASEIFQIEISARKKLIDFYICSRKGCRWHGLSREDLNEIRLEDSKEW